MSDGHVIIIGGAEDKVRERVILTRFVALAGGPDARIAVISTASSLGPLAGEMYRRVFGELGARDVHPIHAMTRAQANDGRHANAVRQATGIFLTGGNQLRLSSTIGGTELAQAVIRRHEEGAVVAGTSAGASALSTHMVAFGASGATPKQRMFQMAAGLGIVPGVIIDQHFEQRNRLGRLLAIIAQNPSLLGIGVDEDTAAVVGPDRICLIYT
jgi:cyanophycinase